jgi:hypothetical protein
VADYQSANAGHPVPEWPYGDRGLVVRPPADPERDARRAAYRARERAKLVQAFDRFLERMWDDPYGERPEWAEPMAFLPIYSATPPTGPSPWPAREQMINWLRRRGVGMTPTPGTVARGVELDHADALGLGMPTETVGIHQKAHYGVPPWPENGCPRQGCEEFWNGTPHEHRNPDYVARSVQGGEWRPVPDEHPCSGGRCPSPAAHAEGAHDL